MTAAPFILSALYGDYEAAKPLPPDCADEIPALMFTDNPDLDAPGWTVVPHLGHLPSSRPGPGVTGEMSIILPMLAHKYWKCHPARALRVAQSKGLLTGALAEPCRSCEHYLACIWLDASMEVTCSRAELARRGLAALGGDDWSLMKHPWRDCLYAEGEYSATLVHRYDAPSLLRQLEHYRSLGVPEHGGLFATGHSVRRLTEPVIRLGEAWWRHCTDWSHQDQVSLPALLWLAQQGGTAPAVNMGLPWAGSWNLHPHGRA